MSAILQMPIVQNRYSHESPVPILVSRHVVGSTPVIRVTEEMALLRGFTSLNVRAERVGEIAFAISDLPCNDGLAVIAFDGCCPETILQEYIGQHPESLIEGFTELEKPSGLEWTSNSRIAHLMNYHGSVIIELEPINASEATAPAP